MLRNPQYLWSIKAHWIGMYMLKSSTFAVRYGFSKDDKVSRLNWPDVW